MSVKIFKTKIGRVDQIAADTYLLKVPLLSDTLEFQAGQFVNILVAPPIRRSYSIASAPSQNQEIWLIGDTVVGGPGSQFIASAKAGKEIEFIAPLGNFVYREEQLPAHFFATGTGVVPFISMIEHALKTVNTKRELKLFLGFRNKEDIFFADFFRQLEDEFLNFEFILTLSNPDDDWPGKRGRITAYYLEQMKTNANIAAYICGSRTMIDDVTENLITSGVSPDQIYYEQYYQ